MNQPVIFEFFKCINALFQQFIYNATFSLFFTCAITSMFIFISLNNNNNHPVRATLMSQ